MTSETGPSEAFVWVWLPGTTTPVVAGRLAPESEGIVFNYGRYLARNHSAFWDGTNLSLTPAYDICPQARTGGEAGQAMLIIGEERASRISLCLKAAHLFHLSEDAALSIARHQITVIRDRWTTVCTEAKLSEIDRKFLWRRQFLNAFAFEEAPPNLAALVD